MPTRAGSRCTRQPRRLHRTASLRHESSSIASSSRASTRNHEDGEQQDREGSEPRIIAQPNSLHLHDGTTPIIEQIPEDGGSNSRRSSEARSTPCPGQDHQIPRSGRSNGGMGMSVVDLSDAYVNEDERDDCTPPPRNREASNASSVQRRQVLRDDHRARLRADEFEIGQLARMERFERSPSRSDGVLVILLVVVVVVLLMYGCFCWWNWPEMSYIRKRREEVFGDVTEILAWR